MAMAARGSLVVGKWSWDRHLHTGSPTHLTPPTQSPTRPPQIYTRAQIDTHTGYVRSMIYFRMRRTHCEAAACRPLPAPDPGLRTHLDPNPAHVLAALRTDNAATMNGFQYLS